MRTSEQGRRTLKTASIYFAFVFGAGFLLGMIRTAWIVPEIGTRWGELQEMPIMLVVILLSARRVSRHVVAPTRALFLGVLSLAFLVIAEFSFAFLLRRLTPPEYIASRDPVAGTVYVVLLVVLAVMPALLASR
jgi:hypothetical protein